MLIIRNYLRKRITSKYSECGNPPEKIYGQVRPTSFGFVSK